MINKALISGISSVKKIYADARRVIHINTTANAVIILIAAITRREILSK